MGQAYWKCMEEGCEDDHIYRFKGLCRSCTTYVDGKVSEPVKRVRVTSNGSVIPASEPTPILRGPVTRREQIAMSRQMKMEKKHRIAMRRAKKMMREQNIPPEHQEALDALVAEQIGESVPVPDEEE